MEAAQKARTTEQRREAQLRSLDALDLEKTDSEMELTTDNDETRQMNPANNRGDGTARRLGEQPGTQGLSAAEEKHASAPDSSDEDENEDRVGWTQFISRRRKQAERKKETAPKPVHEKYPPRPKGTPRFLRNTKNEFRIVYRVQGGIDLAKLPRWMVYDAVRTAAAGPASRNEPDKAPKILLQPAQNLVTLSTPSLAVATEASSATTLTVDGKTYPLKAYIASPENTVKVVIHGIKKNTSPEELFANTRVGPNFELVYGRMLGSSETALLTFQGQRAPRQVIYQHGIYECRKYTPLRQICSKCHELGHRADICPRPDVNLCKVCGQSNSEKHQCTVSCRNCGGAHVATAKFCPARRRQPPATPPRRAWQARQSKTTPPLSGKDFPSLPGTHQPRSLSRRRRSRSRGRSTSREESRSRSRDLRGPQPQTRDPRPESPAREQPAATQKVSWNKPLANSQPSKPNESKEILQIAQTGIEPIKAEIREIKDRLASLENCIGLLMRKIDALGNKKIEAMSTLPRQQPAEQTETEASEADGEETEESLRRKNRQLKRDVRRLFRALEETQNGQIGRDINDCKRIKHADGHPKPSSTDIMGSTAWPLAQ